MDCHPRQGERLLAAHKKSGSVRKALVPGQLGVHHGYHHWQSTEGFGSALGPYGRFQHMEERRNLNISDLAGLGNDHPGSFDDPPDTAAPDSPPAFVKSHCRGFVVD